MGKNGEPWRNRTSNLLLRVSSKTHPSISKTGDPRNNPSQGKKKSLEQLVEDVATKIGELMKTATSSTSRL